MKTSHYIFAAAVLGYLFRKRIAMFFTDSTQRDSTAKYDIFGNVIGHMTAQEFAAYTHTSLQTIGAPIAPRNPDGTCPVGFVDQDGACRQVLIR